MATITTTQTNYEIQIAMPPSYRLPQYPQPGQPFFFNSNLPSSIPASLIPGGPRRLRRKSVPVPASPILPRAQVKMRPEYLPPLVIPLRKSSSTIKIGQVQQQQQRVPCPVYRPQPVHPPHLPPVPKIPVQYQQAPPAVVIEIHELPGDFPQTPTPEWKHPDSGLGLPSESLPKMPLTESPKSILDRETVNTLQAYYRFSMQQQSTISSPSLKLQNNKLRRSSAIYVRNPHAIVSPSPTKSRRRSMFLSNKQQVPALQQQQQPQQQPDQDTFNTVPQRAQSMIRRNESIKAGGISRSDTYTSVLSEWEQTLYDSRVDIREEYQPSESLVNEFGEREQEALRELMVFLDEVLGFTHSSESKEDEILHVHFDNSDDGMGMGMDTRDSSWWRDVRRSLA